MQYIIGKINATWSFGAGLLVHKSIDYVGKERLVTKIKRQTATRKCHCGKRQPKHVNFLRVVHENHEGPTYKDNLGQEYLWYRSYQVTHGWERLGLGCSKKCTLDALMKPRNHDIQVRPRYKMAIAGSQKYDLTIPWMNPDAGKL